MFPEVICKPMELFKKISSYITRKVADKLKSLYNSDRADFEKKMEMTIKIVIEYGMLSEEKIL